MTWTTRLRPELTGPFGVEELHNVWFTPKEWPGKGPVASLLIPECEMHFCMLGPDGAPVTFVNRPKTNKKVKCWVRTVCELEGAWRGRILLLRHGRAGENGCQDGRKAFAGPSAGGAGAHVRS